MTYHDTKANLHELILQTSSNMKALTNSLLRSATSPLNRSVRTNKPITYRALYSTMKALVYKSIGEVEVQERPKPSLAAPSDAIVKPSKTTICGTDLHIRKGDVATCAPCGILVHEGVGFIDEVGTSVGGFKKGDKVLISCITSCASCEYCRKGMRSHCKSGGWVLGNTIDGTQAEYVRIPHADSSLYPIPGGVDESAMVMLSDIFPTALECGVLNGKVEPGSTVAIVGAGPIGLAALVMAQLYTPSMVVMIDMDTNRLNVSTTLGATHTVNPESAVEFVKGVTDGKGCDAVIEAVGIPASFELCQRLLAPGGVLANVGVHGTKAELFLQDLWAHNICELSSTFIQIPHVFLTRPHQPSQPGLSIPFPHQCC